MAGAKIPEEASNIAESNDANHQSKMNYGDADNFRPSNLAEHFLELYDNEWTDALEELTDMESKTEEEGIKILFDIVKVMNIQIQFIDFVHRHSLRIKVTHLFMKMFKRNKKINR